MTEKSEQQWLKEKCPCPETYETLQETIERLDRQLHHHAIEEKKQKQPKIEEGL